MNSHLDCVAEFVSPQFVDAFSEFPCRELVPGVKDCS